MDPRTRKLVDEVKEKHNPGLKLEGDWGKYGYHDSFDLDKEKVRKRDNVPRIDALKVSCEEFREKYEKTYTPVVIINDQQHWLAKKKWTVDRIVKKYRNQKFQCGDDYGKPLNIKMKYFVDYMKHTKDDVPLYIFYTFDQNAKINRLLEDYEVPKYFQDDLFHYASENKRPPYRWFVMGSARSGSGIHIDPLGTSAWNALVRGYKRWCLFPTETPRDLVDLTVEEDEGITWFDMVYPKTQESSWPQKYKPLEILQKPGETIFVPAGWWHVVLNLEDTIAVTQNFASVVNFPVVWHKALRFRPKFTKKWYKNLQVARPEIAKIADQVKVYVPTGLNSESSSSESSLASSDSSESSESSESSDSSYSPDSTDSDDEEVVSKRQIHKSPKNNYKKSVSEIPVSEKRKHSRSNISRIPKHYRSSKKNYKKSVSRIPVDEKQSRSVSSSPRKYKSLFTSV